MKNTLQLEKQIKERIIGHMNEDHSDAVLLYARVFGGVQSAESARMLDMTGVDMQVEVNTAAGVEVLTIPLSRPLQEAADARKVLVEMVHEARAKLEGES